MPSTHTALHRASSKQNDGLLASDCHVIDSQQPQPQPLNLAELFSDGELIRRATAPVLDACARGLGRDEVIAISRATRPGIRASFAEERAAALPELVQWAGLCDDELACLARWLRKLDTMPPDIETAGA
ncbi:hypothetical protein WKW80_05745 [Variovorax humicola]|uniref:MarR family transcriptional regulator n=1 Tax=Variovorax humicola TaxID=1769758 RepID=A0ABU8VWD0_9BURK